MNRNVNINGSMLRIVIFKKFDWLESQIELN